KAPKSDASLEPIDLGQYQNPSIVGLFMPIPEYVQPNTIPAEDIVNAEAYFAQLRIAREGLNKRPDNRMGASLKPGGDTTDGPFVKGLVAWELRLVDGTQFGLTQYELGLDKLARKNQVETLHSNESLAALAEKQQLASAQV